MSDQGSAQRRDGCRHCQQRRVWCATDCTITLFGRFRGREHDCGSGLAESETEVSVADAKESYASSQIIINSTPIHEEPKGRLVVDCRRGGEGAGRSQDSKSQPKEKVGMQRFPPPIRPGIARENAVQH